MTSDEFRNLQHGDKINGPNGLNNGLNFIVHNNYRSGTRMVVVVRTEVLFVKDCHKWHATKKQIPLNLVAGTYQVTIDKRID